MGSHSGMLALLIKMPRTLPATVHDLSWESLPSLAYLTEH